MRDIDPALSIGDNRLNPEHSLNGGPHGLGQQGLHNQHDLAADYIGHPGGEEYKGDDRDFKRKYLKKKHWTLNLTVQYPGVEEPIDIETQSSVRVKQLKQLIKERVNSDINPDQLQLRIEGGDVLKKSQATLDDCNIKDKAVVVVEILDKIQASSSNRAKKPAKEEPREPLNYIIKSGNPEEQEPVLGKSEVWRSLRLKQLRKIIQDDLGIKDKVTIKLFANGEELTDDKLTVEDANLLVEGVQVEVMVTQKITIEV